jgi:hypothetical protein
MLNSDHILQKFIKLLASEIYEIREEGDGYTIVFSALHKIADELIGQPGIIIP